jgi:hypothetical protein
VIKRALREPLVQFLLGGALLFALYGVVAEDAAYAPDRIVIDADRVANLAATFQRPWLRPPTQEELEALVRDFVDEEILYREGLALGLDRDDLVIRRRLRQKVEYLHADLVAFESVTEAELEEYFTAHRERYREPAEFSFRHVYVNPNEASGSPHDRANRLLAELREGAALVGDTTLLPQAMQGVSEQEIGSVFGEGFAGDLASLAGESWLGPVASTYGLHLVRIDERIPTRMPELDEVRQEVTREFESARRVEENTRFLEELRARYDVDVRMPNVGASSAPAQASSMGD